MKTLTMLSLAVIGLFTISLISCGPKCAYYHAVIMGIKTPSQQYCGEELKKVEKDPNMVKDEDK